MARADWLHPNTTALATLTLWKIVSMKKILGGLLAVVLACGAAACDSDKKPAPNKPSALARDNSAVKPAWTLDVDAIGQPDVDDGVAVVLAKAPGKSLQIVAMDAATGKKLWSKPWSPADYAPGYTLSADIFTSGSGDKVAVFAVPPKNLKATGPDMWKLPLSVVDLHSGKELHRTPAVDVGTPLEECEDDQDVCFDLFGTSAPVKGHRLDISSGRIKPETDGTPRNARTIGSAGLFSTSDRPGEKVGVAREGKTVWSKPIETLLRKGVTTDNGWNFAHDDKTDIYVGSLVTGLSAKQTARRKAGKGYDYDQSTFTLTAFSGKDGRVLWKRDAARHYCLGIDPDVVRTLCTLSGSVRYDEDLNVKSVLDAKVILEGVNVMDGTTTWKIPLSTAGAEAELAGKGARLSDGKSVVVSTDDGPRLVDLATGKTAPVDKADVFLCEGNIERFTYARPWFIDGEPNTRRNGGSFYTACDPDGKPAAKLTVSAVRDGGESAGKGLYLITDGNGVSGYKVGK